ncbi:MAG: NUDIX domain-containing protein [bacterium]|nr:NUDIX domain-containing protein [bacterium]MDT8395373.1 NUDIX domain-containing protein [bacterium]
MRYEKKAVRTAVVAVVQNDAGHVLLTKRAIPPWQGRWVMPGGKIDLGEPITVALKREVLEEVGLDVHIEGLVDIYEVVPGNDHRTHYVILYYLASPRGGKVKPNESEIEEVVWADRETLMTLDITDGTRHILSKVFTT